MERTGLGKKNDILTHTHTHTHTQTHMREEDEHKAGKVKEQQNLDRENFYV